MRPRSPLALLARLLGYSGQLPRPATTIREDVNNVGYFASRSRRVKVEPLHEPIPDRTQKDYLDWVASL